MQNSIKIIRFLFTFILMPLLMSAQAPIDKKVITTDEAAFLQKMMAKIKESDQKYRNYLSSETMDDALIAQMDSVYEAAGIEAYIAYQRSLDLQLEKTLKDSLWQLQHAIDLQNHLTLKGIFNTYGFLSEELLDKNFFVQLLLLMHPPKDWDIPTYLEEYSTLLKAEVNAGRMPAITYATFYDNIKGKIMKEPQLYGTNQQFDVKSNKVLPPGIVDLQKTNEARKAIGLPRLKEGEYRILDTQK